MSGICRCGHARAEHLRDVGCCVASDAPDDDCDCGVFRPDDEEAPAHEFRIQITSADGRGVLVLRAALDSTPELREALFAIAQEAYRQLGPFTSLDGRDRGSRRSKNRD